MKVALCSGRVLAREAELLGLLESASLAAVPLWHLLRAGPSAVPRYQPGTPKSPRASSRTWLGQPYRLDLPPEPESSVREVFEVRDGAVQDESVAACCCGVTRVGMAAKHSHNGRDQPVYPDGRLDVHTLRAWSSSTSPGIGRLDRESRVDGQGQRRLRMEKVWSSPTTSLLASWHRLGRIGAWTEGGKEEARSIVVPPGADSSREWMSRRNWRPGRMVVSRVHLRLQHGSTAAENRIGCWPSEA